MQTNSALRLAMKVGLGTLLALATASCATIGDPECGLPELSDEEVEKIADAFLKKQSMDEGFRRSAEKRVTARECRYEYEGAEELDSFGVGVVVVVNRKRQVVDFYSSH